MLYLLIFAGKYVNHIIIDNHVYWFIIKLSIYYRVINLYIMKILPIIVNIHKITDYNNDSFPYPSSKPFKSSNYEYSAKTR